MCYKSGEVNGKERVKWKENEGREREEEREWWKKENDQSKGEERGEDKGEFRSILPLNPWHH